MRGFLSRYRPRYVRSLAYMLQASEYQLADYLAWFRRTQDFGAVERRKQLVPTPKAILALSLAWVLALAILAAAAWAAVSLAAPLSYLLAVALLLAAPYLLAYGLCVPLVLVYVLVQQPAELLLVRRARLKLQQHPALKIAIAGSFGKTTMREVLRAVLSRGRRVAAPPHSHNTPLGIAKFVSKLAGDEEVLIFEMGEYRLGDVAKLCQLVQPSLGIITGVNEAHLQKFGSLGRTAQAIFELASYLGDKPTYVNADSELARAHAAVNHILYSQRGVGSWTVQQPSTSLGGTSFTLVGGGVELNLRSKLMGLHQVGSLAAAAHVALALGLTPEQVEDGVALTEPFDHRLQLRLGGSGVATIDDSYNGNPDGVRAAIAFLASLAGRRRFYVTPGLVEMGSRLEAVHREIGSQLARAGIEKVVLVRNSATPYIERGLLDSGYRGEVVWFDDALEAFAALPHLTASGDVVLLQNDWPDQYA